MLAYIVMLECGRTV